MPVKNGMLVGPQGLTAETISRVFIEGTNSQVVEGAPIIASGRANIALTAPTAGNLITVAPQVFTEVPLGIFDLVPYADEPRHYASLVFQNNAREFTDLAQPAYSGHVRLMMVVEFQDFGGNRLPGGGTPNALAYRRYLGNLVRINPIMSGWNNTGDVTIGDASTAQLYYDGIGASRTSLPEVSSFMGSNGSYEVDLGRFSPGARFVQIGMQVAQKFVNTAVPIAYPASCSIYWIALDGPSVAGVKNYPQDWYLGGPALSVNAGGLAAAGPFPIYPDASLLWSTGRSFEKTGSVITLHNGTNQTLSCDCTLSIGMTEAQVFNYNPGGGVIGPQNILSGADGIWLFQDPTAGVGTTVNPDSINVYAVALAGAPPTGVVGVTFS